MKVIITENYNDMSRKAADIIKNLLIKKNDAVLGLATGSTPIGLYKYLIEMNKDHVIDFSKVKTVNLDEYIGIGPDDSQSYRYFMNTNFFNHINIDKNNTYVPNGLAKNLEEEGRRYDKVIADLGGIDLQILGIGNNGHIAFNEPNRKLTAGTHVTPLTESTIKANSRFFDCIDDVPKTALTMGLGQIMKARKIILVASGRNKADAVKQLLNGKITTECPATMLQMHNDVTVIIDKEIAEKLKL